jgi:collagenase-like PrtC family protease
VAVFVIVALGRWKGRFLDSIQALHRKCQARETSCLSNKQTNKQTSCPLATQVHVHSTYKCSLPHSLLHFHTHTHTHRERERERQRQRQRQTRDRQETDRDREK